MRYKRSALYRAVRRGSIGNNMLEGLRLKAGIWYARVHFKRSQEPVVHFTEAVSRAKRALVLLPESAFDPAMLDRVLAYFRQKFQPNKLTLVVASGRTASLREHRGIDLVIYTAEDLNSWFVPRSGLLQKLKKSTFDVAFDLNVGFALPSAYLCRASQAPIRISFTKPYADDFYNFQIQTKQPNSVQSYTNLLKCLEMF
jgi:ADP-heptose:LPS heptosyltransferase